MMARRTMIVRYCIAAATATSGYLHADLYIHGYRYVDWIGPMFLVQAAGSFAVTVLLLVTDTAIPQLGAAGLAGGALVGFVLSRTVGILGFTERGWQPAPQAALTVLTEMVTLLLLAFASWRRRHAVITTKAH